MNRIARFIENEFDKNRELFNHAYVNLDNSIDFIDIVLKDKNLIILNEEEAILVERMRESYFNMKKLIGELNKELSYFKESFQNCFTDKC